MGAELSAVEVTLAAKCGEGNQRGPEGFRMSKEANVDQTMASLSAAQRWLVEVMRENQFGRVENLRVESGTPILDSNVRVVRVSRLGGELAEVKMPVSDGGPLHPEAAEYRSRWAWRRSRRRRVS